MNRCSGCNQGPFECPEADLHPNWKGAIRLLLAVVIVMIIVIIIINIIRIMMIIQIIITSFHATVNLQLLCSFASKNMFIQANLKSVFFID